MLSMLGKNSTDNILIFFLSFFNKKNIIKLSSAECAREWYSQLNQFRNISARSLASLMDKYLKSTHVNLLFIWY